MLKSLLSGGITRELARGTGHWVRRSGTIVADGIKWARELRALLADDSASDSASERSRISGPAATSPEEPVSGPRSTLAAGIPHARERDSTHEIPLHATVPDHDFVPGSLRHELSSLQGSHALAPDESAVGEELIDPDVVEVPLGSSSDPSFAGQLSHGKGSQPDTTGGALFEYVGVSGRGQEVRVASADAPEVTAQPSRRPVYGDEHYDAIEPESAGLEWLSRATQAPYSSGADAEFDDLHVDDEVGAVAISEASFEAGLPHEGLSEDQDEEARYEEEALRDGWSRPDAIAMRSVRPEGR
ncbi:MAG TPA: hypothetical protein VK524_26540 [Polyangiaceae bacterium]|nr:hypothetical protein [Polyangiaceae bacterium]